MRSSAGSISLAQRMVDETRAKRDQGDGTKFDPYATLSQSHLSFGCLFQDPEDRSSFKIVITLSQENTLLICKNGTVHESLPARAIKDIVASSRPDVQIITTDGSASCVCYSFNLKVDPIYTVDGSSGRHFLMGSLYDVQMLTKYLTMLMAGKKLSLIPVPQYDKAGFVQFGRDGLWSNKWCVLAGERMLFYNEKRSEIPFQCFTLPSIHSFEMSGFNTSHEPLPQPAHLMHLPPEYPYTATLNVGVDIEILQWNYEEDAQDWHEDVMERRAQVINEYEQELESAKKAKQDLELAALEQEKRLEEQKKKAQRQRIKPLQIFPFVTHTRPQCAYIAYRMPTPVQGVTGGSLLFNDSSEALMAQSLNLTNLPALNNKLIVEVAMGGGSESTYVNHQENIQSDYFLLQDVPEPGVPPTAPTGHCCVITAQGQAYIWGEGGPGVLGLGPDKVQQRVPILMTPLIKNVIVQVSCGYNHTIMLTNKGEVLTFGLNHYGQLGLNQQDADSGYPRRVEEIEDPVRYIYAAGNSSFALTTNGHCYVWGSNANNILGLLGPEFVPLPTIQPDLSGCLQQISISPDATHGLALLYHPNGAPDAATQYAATVLAWGANSRGQLGMGSGAKDEILFTTPSAVPKLTNIALHVNEEVMDVASVMDNANIIGICATNGASAVWHSNMEVMIWGRAGVTGFGSDSSSPHKLRANNIAVINMVAASCGFIFMDNNNALFQSNDTQGIYALAVQSKTSNASQPLYCSIVAPFLGPLRTLPKADGDAVGVGCCAFALTLSGSTPSQSSVPQGQAPQAMGMTNFASTSRSPQQAAPGAAGIQYQPPKAAAGGYNPPTSGGSNLYVAGRKLGGPAMPKRAPPPPPGLDEAPTSRAGQAQVQVGAMLHHANQSGLMNNAQNQEAIQKDVLMAASLILGLHQEASTRAQQAAAPPKPQGMDFMQMVNNMPTTPQQQQQQPQQQQQFAYQQQQPQQQQQQPQQFAYQQQQQQPQQQFAYQQQQQQPQQQQFAYQQQQQPQQQFAYQQQQQPQAPQPQYAQYQQVPPSQPPSQPPQQQIGGFPPPPPEDDDDDMPPPPPGAFAAPRQQQQYQAPPQQQQQQYQAPPPQQHYQAPPQQQYQAPQQQYQAPPPQQLPPQPQEQQQHNQQQLPPQPQEQQQHNQQQQFGQANIQTQQQLGGGFAQPNAQVANMVTSSGVLSVPSQPQAPQSRTFNNKFLAPKQQQMKQELNNVVPPPPPPDDDEDF